MMFHQGWTICLRALVIAMSLRRRVLGVSALTILAAWLPHEARAQGMLDRIKKLGQNTATAGKKAVVDEANGQINSAVQDAASEHVADGSFIAVLSPWSSTGVAKRVEIARFSGEAFVVTTPNSREILLCDDKSAQSWLTSFAIQKKAPVNGAVAASAPGAVAHAGTPHAGTPHDGVAAGSAGAAHGVAHVGGSAAHSAGGAADSTKSKSDSAGKSAPDPFSATNESFSFPSTQVTVTVPAAGATSGKPSRGSLTVADLSQSILGGAGKIRFSQATIPGEKGPQVVDMGVTFKARVMAPGDAPVGCGTGTGKAATAAKPPGGASPQAFPAVTSAPTAAPIPGASFAEGDVLLPKIGNVKMLAASNDSSKVAATVNLGDALVYLGQEENGYVHVQGSAGEGWVRKALLNKR
jgi:hypothetical protein